MPGWQQARPRPRVVLTMAACALGAVAGLTSPAFGSDNSVSVTVAAPETVLTPGASARGVLVVTNAGTTSASRVNVRPVVADASIAVTMPKTRATIPAGGSIPLAYTVMRSTEGTGQDVTVRFVVTYRQAVAATAKPVSQVAVASLTVKAAATRALVEAKIESNIGTINENRPGEGALVVANPRETAVRLDAVQVSAPTSVDVILACPKGNELTTPGGTTKRFTECLITIAPRSQEVLDFTLKTAESVAPGPRSALFRVEASKPDAHASASVIVPLAFTVDVFAESDILKAVGVPVFLLLPGVIVVLTSWFLIRRLSPWRRIASSVAINQVISAATGTAILGLAVSLAIAAAYPKLTRDLVPGYERDYLRAYGFRDFYYVFGYSFAIAIAVWVISLVASIFIPIVRWLFMPAENDDEQSLLRKVGLRGLLRGPTVFQRVTVDQGARGLALGRRPGGKVLIAPVISINIDESKAPGLAQTIETNASTGHAFRLWREIRRAVRENKATIAYRAGDVAKPQLMDESKVSPSAQLGAIVEVTPQ
jgi:hypothetical protein